MLYILPETTGDIIVLQANGTLNTADYNDTFLPLFQHVKNTHPEVRLLLTFAPDCSGFEQNSPWQDKQFAAAHSHDLYRLAIVGHDSWQDWMNKLAQGLQQGAVRHYKMTQLLQALHWINDEDKDNEEGEKLYPFSN